MHSKGLDFLRPIWAMVYSDEEKYWVRKAGLIPSYDTEIKGLKLSESDVSVTYTRYINNYKTDPQLNEKTIDEAVEAKLTPGKKFQNYSRK